MMDLHTALNESLTTKNMDVEAQIIPALSSIVNSFGKHDEEVAKAVLQNDVAKKNFLMVAAGCMVALGYMRKCEDMHRGHWDDRNAASSKYCKEHLDEFLEMFENAAGFPIQFKEHPEHQCFQHDTLLGKMDTRGFQIAEEVEKFLQEHPTLQQSMIGVFLRVISENNLYPEIDPEGFPFI